MRKFRLNCSNKLPTAQKHVHGFAAAKCGKATGKKLEPQITQITLIGGRFLDFDLWSLFVCCNSRLISQVAEWLRHKN